VSYRPSDDAYCRFLQARDAIWLMRHSSMNVEPGITRNSALVASYQTPMVNQFSVVPAKRNSGTTSPGAKANVVRH
jgi:hypothetical protein